MIVPLIVTGKVRGVVAPQLGLDAANEVALADLADGWTVAASSEFQRET